MSLSIDDIYDLFTWDVSYSSEEYASREEMGIQEASKLKYLFPFLQPIIPGTSQSVWEPCAKVIAMRSDEDLEPYLCHLLCWLQDMNWPGAEIIRDRLCCMPFVKLETAFNFSVYRAKELNDIIWLSVLDEFRENHPLK